MGLKFVWYNQMYVIRKRIAHSMIFSQHDDKLSFAIVESTGGVCLDENGRDGCTRDGGKGVRKKQPSTSPCLDGGGS